MDGKTHFADDDTLRYIAKLQRERDTAMDERIAAGKRIEELEQQRDELLALVESAFKEGFCAPATYNDTVLNDSDDEWERSESCAAIAKVTQS